MNSKSETTDISTIQYQNMHSKELDPATLGALKNLSIVTSNKDVDKFSNCNKLTASLEQIRSKKNLKLFEKLDAIKQDFLGLNLKIAEMELSISDLKKSTSNLVKSLPSDGEAKECGDLKSAR